MNKKSLQNEPIYQKKIEWCRNQEQLAPAEQPPSVCPFGYQSKFHYGSTYCAICGSNSFFNPKEKRCEQCSQDSVCFLGSGLEWPGIKSEMNKFNITN